MKSLTVLAAAVAFAGISLPAQQTTVGATATGQPAAANAPQAAANPQAAATPQAAQGFGDEAAARWHDMASMSCELQGHLDSKAAKVGDRVVVKTTEKTQTSDGTAIPRGSRLVGHVTEVQAHSREHADAQIGIAFDHFELKSGASVPVHTLIRRVRPPVSLPSMNAMDNGGMMGPGGMGGGPSGAMGNGSSATAPGGQAVSEAAGGTITRSGEVASTGTPRNVGPDPPLGPGGNESAHADSAPPPPARGSAPRPSGIPGILLAGSSTASGLFFDAAHRDVELYDGTQFDLGVAVDR